MLTCFDVAECLGLGNPKVEPNGWSAIRCPGHDDRNPSLRISPDGLGWRCMVCKVGGDPLALWAWARGITRYAARREWAGDEQPLTDGQAQLLDALERPKREEVDRGPWLLRFVLRSNRVPPAAIDAALLSADPATMLKKCLTDAASSATTNEQKIGG
jgi:hypothetical protein